MQAQRRRVFEPGFHEGWLANEGERQLNWLSTVGAVDHAARDRLLLLIVVLIFRLPGHLGHVLEELEATEGVGEGLGLKEVLSLLVHVSLSMDWARPDHHLLSLELLVALHELLEGQGGHILLLHWIIVREPISVRRGHRGMESLVPWKARVEHWLWRKLRIHRSWQGRELLGFLGGLLLFERRASIELRISCMFELIIVFLLIRRSNLVKPEVRLGNGRVSVWEWSRVDLEAAENVIVMP